MSELDWFEARRNGQQFGGPSPVTSPDGPGSRFHLRGHRFPAGPVGRARDHRHFRVHAQAVGRVATRGLKKKREGVRARDPVLSLLRVCRACHGWTTKLTLLRSMELGRGARLRYLDEAGRINVRPRPYFSDSCIVRSSQTEAGANLESTLLVDDPGPRGGSGTPVEVLAGFRPGAFDLVQVLALGGFSRQACGLVDHLATGLPDLGVFRCFHKNLAEFAKTCHGISHFLSSESCGLTNDRMSIQRTGVPDRPRFGTASGLRAAGKPVSVPSPRHLRSISSGAEPQSICGLPAVVPRPGLSGTIGDLAGKNNTTRGKR